MNPASTAGISVMSRPAQLFSFLPVTLSRLRSGVRLRSGKRSVGSHQRTSRFVHACTQEKVFLVKALVLRGVVLQGVLILPIPPCALRRRFFGAGDQQRRFIVN